MTIHASFEVKTNIEKATDSDSYRYSGLNRVHIMPDSVYPGEQVHLSATDGKCLALNLVDGFSDDVYSAPRKLLNRGKVKRDLSVKLNGQWENSKGVFSSNEEQETVLYPNFGDVAGGAIKDGQKYATVTIDPAILMRLIESVVPVADDDKEVTIQVPIDDSGEVSQALRVMSGENVGLLMPMHDSKWEEKTEEINGKFRRFATSWESLENPKHAKTEPKKGGAE
jgi:hypothetical protein